MAPNPRRRRERLQALYDQLPPMDCKGLCHPSCTAVGMSVQERTDVEGALGDSLRLTDECSCSALTADGRCAVYENRPMVCRLWGLTEDMPCPWGCRPEGGLLPAARGRELMRLSMDVGGDPGLTATLGADVRKLAAILSTPEGHARAVAAGLGLPTKPRSSRA